MDKKKKQERFIEILRTIKDKKRDSDGILTILEMLEQENLLAGHLPALQQLARNHHFAFWCAGYTNRRTYCYEHQSNFIESRTLEYLLNEARLTPEEAEDTVDFFRVIASTIDIRCAENLTESEAATLEEPLSEMIDQEESTPGTPVPQNSILEAATPEEPLPETADPEESVPRTPVPQDVTLEAATPEEPITEMTEPEESTPERTIPQDSGFETAPPEEPPSEMADPEESTSKEPMPRHAAHKCIVQELFHAGKSFVSKQKLPKKE